VSFMRAGGAMATNQVCVTHITPLVCHSAAGKITDFMQFSFFLEQEKGIK